MKSPRILVFAALFSILCYSVPALAQHSEHPEETAAHASEDHHQEHAEEGEHEEHGEDHGGRPHHKNDVALFLGVTDEHGHDSEFTWGFDYRRMVSNRVAVGGLFDYAGGDLRNAILAASVTWFPVGRLQLTAAPGIEFHRGRGATGDCGCGHALKSADPDEAGLFDEDESHFLFRLGAGYYFPVGNAYGIIPNVNLDLVDGEKVWVYGFNFAYAW